MYDDKRIRLYRLKRHIFATTKGHTSYLSPVTRRLVDQQVSFSHSICFNQTPRPSEQLWYSSLVESAYVCGIDAEWEPGLPTATATLLQLAFTTVSPHQPGSFVLLLVSCTSWAEFFSLSLYAANPQRAASVCGIVVQRPHVYAGFAFLTTISGQGLSARPAAQC